MLVLSRKKDESIVINNDITIVVVEIRGDKVRLGVEAPKEVPVHRREVYDAIARGEPLEIQLGSPTQVASPAPETTSDEISEGRSAGPEESRPPANDGIP
jgi:carbon storage regulator